MSSPDAMFSSTMDTISEPPGDGLLIGSSNSDLHISTTLKEYGDNQVVDGPTIPMNGSSSVRLLMPSADTVSDTSATGLAKTSELYSNTPGSSIEDFRSTMHWLSNMTDTNDVVVTEESHKVWLAQQEKRKVLVQKTCQKHALIKKPPDYSRILVDEENKVLLCTIPKAGCTSWKWLLARLQQDPLHQKIYQQDMDNNVKLAFIHRQRFLERYGIKTLDTFSSPNIDAILKTYTKIITVRDPLERMMSGYKDKLVPHDDGKCPYCEVIGKKIIKYYRKDGPVDKNGRTVTEVEFLQALVGDKNRVDIIGGHWASYNSLCGPCFVRYDYISHLETADEDADNLIKFIFNSTLRLPHHNPGTSKHKHMDVLKNISSELKKQLLQKYQIDMELFGYKWPDRT